MALRDAIQELQQFKFDQLDVNNIGAWPKAIKGLVLGDFENCEFYTTADLFDAGTTDDSQYIVAKWKEGAKTIAPSLDLVGKI